MNFKSFLKTLAAAAIGGAVTSTAEAITTTDPDFTKLGPVAAAGAIVGAAGYLVQSPRPPKPKKTSRKAE